MIDGDPQGSMTISLGYREPDSLEYTLSTLLSEVMEEKKLSLTQTIIQLDEGVDLIPANIELSALEINLVNAMSREVMLRSIVEYLKAEYDYKYIIIDCIPSLGMLTINALACADSVLIPVQAAYLPVKGLEQLIKTIGRVQRRLNKNLRIEGILLTMVDARTNYARDISQLVIDTYANQIGVFQTCIHNHIIFNSTNISGTKKFRNFFLSSLVVRHLSDTLCLEHGLSVIKPKQYRDQEKRMDYPKRESCRDAIRDAIDRAIARNPKDFEELLRLLEEEEYQIRRNRD